MTTVTTSPLSWKSLSINTTFLQRVIPKLVMADTQEEKCLSLDQLSRLLSLISKSHPRDSIPVHRETVPYLKSVDYPRDNWLLEFCPTSELRPYFPTMVS